MLDAFERDIQESIIHEQAPEILEMLLADRTMTAAEPHARLHHIRWCTEDYGFPADAEMAPEDIAQPGAKVICPRVDKRMESQRRRSVQRAEVFTPSWICNKQNNLVDQAWFGRETGLFNQEVVDVKTGLNTWESTWSAKKPIAFPPGRTWQEYVTANRLEVACGEAPYLTSRYDTTTGAPIPVNQRIGFLDRKLRVISEQVGSSRAQWLDMAEKALKSCYGFEWQGDNVFLARENMLYAVLEAYYWQYGGAIVPLGTQRCFAEIISWNIWQMDGIKFVAPNTCQDMVVTIPHLDGTIERQVVPCKGCKSGKAEEHNGIRCRIMDWEIGKPVLFMPPFEFKPIEEVGSGTTDIFEHCASHGLEPPIFEVDARHVSVTVMRPTFDEHGRKVGRKIAKVGAKGAEVGQKNAEVGANGTEVGQKVDFGALASVGRKDFRMMCERVFKCLAKDSRMSRRRISQVLGIAESTVQCATNALQEVGLLRREGRGKGSNWIVVPEPSQPITKPLEPRTKARKPITKRRVSAKKGKAAK